MSCRIPGPLSDSVSASSQSSSSAKVFVPLPPTKPGRKMSINFHHLDSIVPDDYEMIQALDLNDVEPGSMTYCYLELVGTCTGNPYCIPIMIAKGKLPGPVLGMIAAVHGDEVNGTPAIHAVFRDVSRCLDKMAGTIIGVPIANVPSYTRHQRTFPDQAREVDLNRLFPGKADATTAEKYVHSLFNKVVLHMDYLIDLHSACFGNLNSMYIRADLEDEVVRQMAYTINADIILHSKGPSGGTKSGNKAGMTLRAAATLAGVKTLCIELKNASQFDPKVILRAHLGILSLLAELGVIPDDAGFVAEHQAEMEEHRIPPIVCERSYWIFTKAGGLLSVLTKIAAKVSKGQCLGITTDLFGIVRSQVYCPEDGIVIGQSQDPAQNEGGRVVHLGILAPEGRFSHVPDGLAKYEQHRKTNAAVTEDKTNMVDEETSPSRSHDEAADTQFKFE